MNLRRFGSQPLQTILTVLALVLGVAVVTAVSAFLDVSRQTQERFAKSLWARELTLQTREDEYLAHPDSGTGLVREVGSAGDKPVTLTQADMERARAAAPSVSYAFVTTPTCNDIPDSGLRFERIAVSRDYFPANNVTFAQGTRFSESDFVKQRRVAVISERMAGLLQLGENPVGRTVQARDCDALADFTVVGVITSRPDAEQPDFIIPFRPDLYNAMDAPHFAVENAAVRNEARAELASFAAKEWGGRVTVHTNNVEGYLAQERTTRLLVAVLASIGLTSAALNLMNLTLARVLTGRREVGILRSLGATRADIRGQYFTTALIMGVVGGLAGVALGYGFLAVFNLYVAAASPTQMEAVRPSLLSLSTGLVSAIGLSLLFTIYPAQLAARASIVAAVKEQ